jgi:hypothetical protein
VLDFTA